MSTCSLQYLLNSSEYFLVMMLFLGLSASSMQAIVEVPKRSAKLSTPEASTLLRLVAHITGYMCTVGDHLEFRDDHVAFSWPGEDDSDEEGIIAHPSVAVTVT